MHNETYEKVCLIGVGAIGGLHLEAYERHRSEMYIGVVEIDDKKRHAVESRVNHTYDSLELALTDNYQLYDIALPTFLHYDALDKILDKTTALILCEKPLVLEDNELLKLIAKYPDFDKRVKCAFVERFNEPFLLAKQWIDERKGPFQIRLERRTKKPTQAAWFGKPNQGGDVMLDLGVHDIDVAVWWTGSLLESIDQHFVKDDCETVVMHMLDGSEVLLVTGWDLPTDCPTGIVNTFELQSGQDYFRYDTASEQVTEYAKIKSVTPRYTAAYFNEIDTALGKRDDLCGNFPKITELAETMRIVSIIQKDRR